MKISVCIPTYNGEKYIFEQIDSILKQLKDDDEIIVSDDSSNDRTLEILNSFKDDRIKVLSDQKFGHWIFNLQNALYHCDGEIIFLADQDDVWVDNKVEKTLPYLREYDLVLSDCVVVDENLQTIYPSMFQLLNARKGFWNNFIRNKFLGCCLAFRRDILNKSLPFPRNLKSHDTWIGLIAEIYGKTVFLSEKLILYRRHGGNASVASEKSKYNVLQRIAHRIELSISLVKRIFEIMKSKQNIL